jgi:cytochrome c oxidase subunit 3
MLLAKKSPFEKGRLRGIYKKRLFPFLPTTQLTKKAPPINIKNKRMIEAIMTHKKDAYYLPSPSSWPLRGSIALISIMLGAANWLHDAWFGPYLLAFGFYMLFRVIYGWFGTVILENRQGLLDNPQVDRSFRWGMCWFIFSEVMFFGAFFGALFYVRVVVAPILGGTEGHLASHLLLWPQFQAAWPPLKNPSAEYLGPESIMNPWGIPALNTLILLTSGVTITIAHVALLKSRRTVMLVAQLATIALGILFLFFQAHEYAIAYTEKGLTLGSGIYGTTFFMLTGFHGLHVTIGTIGLCVIFYRMLIRDFDSHHHFAFEAISWYWHFVDVVWLILFIFVYWL